MKDFRLQEKDAWEAVKEYYPNQWQSMVASARATIKSIIRMKKFNDTPEHTREAVRYILYSNSILDIKPLALLAATYVVNVERELAQKKQAYNTEIFIVEEQLKKLESNNWSNSIKQDLKTFYNSKLNELNTASNAILD